MALKILACVFAVIGQSLAGPWPIVPPNCGCNSPDINVPIYNCEGVVISDIDSCQTYKHKSISSSKIQSSYKPVAYSEEIYKPVYPDVSSAIFNNGGALFVSSVGPIAPFGIGVASDISLAGELVLTGTVPYLSAVAFEGQFDSSGTAPVEYGCGDCVAITEQIGGNYGFSGYDKYKV